MLNKKIQGLLDNPGLFNSFRHFIDPGQIQMMKLVINKYKPKSILDVGCGTGDFSVLPCQDYVGIDTTKSFIDYARKKYPNDNVFRTRVFHLANATKMNFKKEKFDAALLLSFMHHMSDKQMAVVLKSLKKTAKKVIILDLLPVNRGITKFFYSLDRGGHVRCLRSQEKLIKDNGYKVIETMHFKTPWPGIYYHTLFVCKPK